jgi:hypothetical protein
VIVAQNGIQTGSNQSLPSGFLFNSTPCKIYIGGLDDEALAQRACSANNMFSAITYISKCTQPSRRSCYSAVKDGAIESRKRVTPWVDCQLYLRHNADLQPNSSSPYHCTPLQLSQNVQRSHDARSQEFIRLRA